MKNSLLVFVLFIGIALTSCNQLKLEKHEAKDLIIKELGLPQKHSIDLKIIGDNKFLNDALQNEGIINFNWEKQGLLLCLKGVTVTEKGKAYFLGKTSEDTYRFKTYDTDFGEITGISINKNDQTATIRFTTNSINVTPIAMVLSNGWFGEKYIHENLNGPKSQEIVLKKFDSGWQIK